MGGRVAKNVLWKAEMEDKGALAFGGKYDNEYLLRGMKWQATGVHGK